MNNNITNYRAYAARGFSLVELMIALLIGLIISIGVVQIFSASRATYQLDEGLARAQENGRFALEFLTQDIRHAGYLGCNRDTTRIPFNYLSSVLQQRLPITGVSGFEYNATGINATYVTPPAPANVSTGWAPAATPIFPASALPGTDIIAVQRMVSNTWALVPPYVTPDNVFLDPLFAPNVKNSDILLVADCRQAAVFKVTTIIPATGVISHTVGPTTNRCARWTSGLDAANAANADCTNVFENPVPSTAIGSLETVVFYVANDNNNSGRPTLFKNVIDASGGVVAQALVEGVENFQVLYGVDNGATADGIADQYVPADLVTNFSQVVSVQIGILVYGVNATGSATDSAIDTQVQNVAGTNIVPPADRRKRHAFNTTIQLRNRGF